MIMTGLIALVPRGAAAQPAHLIWALELVDNVTPALNQYEGSPHYVTWPGVKGAVNYSNHTLCSGFLTVLLKQSNGWTDWDIQNWLGTTGPSAATYHDAIVDENGFDRVLNVADIEAGDVIAIRYPTGSSMTGHVAIVDGPVVLHEATLPLVPGTFQFELAVVDSTKRGHGPLDSRLRANGTWQSGAGIGVMRLYTDGALNVVGHAWSTSTGSEFLSEATYPVAIGRLM
jgi:hypothetical protein